MLHDKARKNAVEIGSDVNLPVRPASVRRSVKPILESERRGCEKRNVGGILMKKNKNDELVKGNKNGRGRRKTSHHES